MFGSPRICSKPSVIFSAPSWPEERLQKLGFSEARLKELEERQVEMESFLKRLRPEWVS
ncbi:unnamed protein product, partial [marine sediment metagenome]